MLIKSLLLFHKILGIQLQSVAYCLELRIYRVCIPQHGQNQSRVPVSNVALICHLESFYHITVKYCHTHTHTHTHSLSLSLSVCLFLRWLLEFKMPINVLGH